MKISESDRAILNEALAAWLKEYDKETEGQSGLLRELYHQGVALRKRINNQIQLGDVVRVNDLIGIVTDIRLSFCTIKIFNRQDLNVGANIEDITWLGTFSGND